MASVLVYRFYEVPSFIRQFAFEVADRSSIGAITGGWHTPRHFEKNFNGTPALLTPPYSYHDCWHASSNE